MPVYTLRRIQVVKIALESCWRLFSNPANLSKITPPQMRFRVRSELPEEIYPGLMIQYTVSPVLRLPLTWVTEITHVRRPEFFVDEQRIGPYRLWHHEHSFSRDRRSSDGSARSDPLCAAIWSSGFNPELPYHSSPTRADFRVSSAAARSDLG